MILSCFSKLREIGNENKESCKYPRPFPILAWEALIFGAPLKRTSTSLTENWPLSWSELLYSYILLWVVINQSLYDSNFRHCSWIKELHLMCYKRSSKGWTQSVLPNIVYYCISVMLCSKSTELFAFTPHTFPLLFLYLLKLLLLPNITSL